MSDLGGFSMWDLFRGEVEAQMKVFTDGLLAIENGEPAEQHLAATMRAAHSIKGAARIVQLDEGVKLAHLMEDCLVAAQEGSLALNSAGIDVLLSAGDLLTHLAALAEAEVPPWITEQRTSIDELLGQLELVRAGTWEAPEQHSPTTAEPAAPVSEPVTTEIAQAGTEPGAAPQQETKSAVHKAPGVPPAPAATTQATAPSTKTDGAERSLRVTAQTLNRLVALTGESLIQTRRVETLAESMVTLRKRQLELGQTLEMLQSQLEELPGEAGEMLAAARGKLEAMRQETAERHHGLESFAISSSRLSERLYREALSARMRPFGDGVEGFPRLVRDVSKQLGKQAQIEIIGRQTEVDREILERLEAPLNHAIRNSLDHGIESPEERAAAGKPTTGTIRLEARHRAGLFMLSVSDDGRGVNIEGVRSKVVQRGLATEEMAANFTDAEVIEFLFLPGFSTAAKLTEISGRGVGLDALREMVKSVGGTVRLTSTPGRGMVLTLELPLTLSVMKTLVADIGGEPFAFPLTRIAHTVTVPFSDLVTLESQQYFNFNEERVGVVPAQELLGMPQRPTWDHEVPILLLGDQSERYGLAVNRFLGEHDMVIQPLDSRLGKIQDVSACALMNDGSPVLILDIEDLVQSMHTELQGGRLRGLDHTTASKEHRQRILVVDDSITVREVERSLLKGLGYDVEVAVDGMDGWNALRSSKYDLLVTDVDMPRMTGIELVTRVKADPGLQTMPVIIVSYKDREEDRLKGLEAGADRYMTKSSFHDETFVSAVQELVGHPE